MSTDARRVMEPIAGRWNWRHYLPCCESEFADLEARAANARPVGVDIPRWLHWVRVQLDLAPDVGVVRSERALAKYRRFLYELNVDHQPKCECGEAPRIHASVAFCRPSGVAA